MAALPASSSTLVLSSQELHASESSTSLPFPVDKFPPGEHSIRSNNTLLDELMHSSAVNNTSSSCTSATQLGGCGANVSTLTHPMMTHDDGMMMTDSDKEEDDHDHDDNGDDKHDNGDDKHDNGLQNSNNEETTRATKNGGGADDDLPPSVTSTAREGRTLHPFIVIDSVDGPTLGDDAPHSLTPSVSPTRPLARAHKIMWQVKSRGDDGGDDETGGDDDGIAIAPATASNRGRGRNGGGNISSDDVEDDHDEGNNDEWPSGVSPQQVCSSTSTTPRRWLRREHSLGGATSSGFASSLQSPSRFGPSDPNEEEPMSSLHLVSPSSDVGLYVPHMMIAHSTTRATAAAARDHHTSLGNSSSTDGALLRSFDLGGSVEFYASDLLPPSSTADAPQAVGDERERWSS